MKCKSVKRSHGRSKRDIELEQFISDYSDFTRAMQFLANTVRTDEDRERFLRTYLENHPSIPSHYMPKPPEL